MYKTKSNVSKPSFYYTFKNTNNGMLQSHYGQNSVKS